MATEPKKFPVGIQTFSDIITGGYAYVDKTGYLYEIVNRFKYVFLSRPRRFGKSLFASTLHSFFAGEKELFDGLEAGRLESEWTTHPVLHFDMSTAKHTNPEQLLGELDIKLSGYEDKFGRNPEEKYVNQRLEGLVKRAYHKTGNRVVIIIDEYDAPLLDVMNSKDLLQPMRQIMRNFYSPIKSLDPYLRFVFITGINKFAQLSIFSELNNLMNISMLPEYSALCGISQSELENSLKESVKEFAESQNVSLEEAFALLKENYDGYHFCADSEDIYNPYSLIKCLATKTLGSYWFESGTPTYLLERLDRNPIDERELDAMAGISIDTFDVSPEVSDDSIPMLYQTGYLTIKSYDRQFDSYTLGYPNKEVRGGFLKSLLARYRSTDPKNASFVLQFNIALQKGDISSALERLQTYLSAIPNDLENKSEKHYQTIIYLIFSLLGYYIQTEVKSATGRADAVCKTATHIFVFEFKVDSTAETALKQIEDKGYLIPYKFEEGKTLVKVGVNISSSTRSIESWAIG